MDKLVDEGIPWEQVVPDVINEWMTQFAVANFIPKKLLLSTMLGVVSALVRKSVIEYYPGQTEFCNLFILCLGESGCGKSNACSYACIRPIRAIEKECDGVDPIIIDDCTVNGVFQAFAKSDDEFVPLIAIDECHQFFKNVINGKRGSLDIRKMCRLYDGAWWSEQKGAGKRVESENAVLSCLTYTTPFEFYKDVWSKVVKSKDGMDDRFLITFVKTQEDVSIYQRMDAKLQLQTSPMRELNLLYKKIFMEHQSKRVYTLSQEARERVIKYDHETKGMGSKVCKNALKLVVNFHVLFHRLHQVMTFSDNPTPIVIEQKIVDMALSFLDVLLRTSVASRSIGQAPLSYTTQDIAEVMVTVPGPFVTARSTYNRFPSNRRPSPERTLQAFEELHKTLGNLKKVGVSSVFYKKLPSMMTDELAQQYNISSSTYEKLFIGKDKSLTETQIRTYHQKHPELDAYDEYMEEQRLPVLPATSQTVPGGSLVNSDDN